MTLYAVANDGYRFVNWTKGGMEVSTNATHNVTITEASNFVANFEKEATATEYPTPTGDTYTDNYLTSITTTGGDTNIDYSANAHPGQSLVVVPGKVQLEKGKSFTMSLIAKSLGAGSSSTTREDMRYCHASLFTDFDQDFTFEASPVQTWGNKPPTNNVYGNYDYVMNVTYSGATWNNATDSWWVSVVTNTTPAVTVKTTDGTPKIGYSTFNEVRHPYLLDGNSFTISVPANCKITGYRLGYKAHNLVSKSVTYTNGKQSTGTITIAQSDEENTLTVTGLDNNEISFSVEDQSSQAGFIIKSLEITYVENEFDVPSSHIVRIGTAGYSTLYLDFPAYIPDGLEIYVIKAEGINEEEGYISMTEIKDGIPAYTGVIIKGEPGEFQFDYSNENYAEIEENLLKGTVADAYITEESYVLSVVDGEAGLYLAQMNQLDGTAFKNNANKAYLPKSTATNLSATFYGFGWNGTTGIDNVNGDSTAGAQNSKDRETIFDLFGRRIESINSPGIYIVNGRKVLVK